MRLRSVGMISSFSIALVHLASYAIAFPIPIGVSANFDSHDMSHLMLVGPSPGEPPLQFPTPNGPIIVPSGASVTMDDVKNKNGNGSIKAITGDPLAVFGGPITGGSGTITVTSSGVAELFPSSTIHLNFISGSLETGITLPGNQLVGPDGNDTFMNYTTSWSSFDPIGRFSNGSPVVLGQFTLNSVGRPSSFSYSLNPDLSGHMNFTIGENLTLTSAAGSPTGPSIVGTVTKSLDFTPIPESSTWLLLSTGLAVIALRARRRSQSK
ncbi:MAG: PEP-CTERM sorting domain-containing protein [Nitrospirales bacterium]